MRILSVDDNAENLYLIEMIARAHGHEVVSARNGVEALEKLAEQKFNLIISDVLMPQMDGFQLCRTLKSDDRYKQVPFIFYTATYTGKPDEELGLALGASRFIVKPVEPQEFLTVIEQVVNEGEAGNIPLPPVDFDDGGMTLSLYNERLVRKLEHKIGQLEAARAELATAIAAQKREIDQRRGAEAALARSEEQLRLMWHASMDGMLLTDREGIILRANPALARLFAKPLDSLPGELFTSLFGEDPEPHLAMYRERLNSRNSEAHLEMTLRRWDGELIWVEESSAAIDLPEGPAVFSILRDMTERYHGEQKRAVLEDQLRQAQKLESVGRLAGGVAHDFNNLLTVISGYVELVLGELPAGHPLRPPLEEIRGAGGRAAELTRRLLAFSRKQALQPRVFDLNDVIRGTSPMLSRMLGEDVTLSVALSPEPAIVYADRHQLEQVLMNLAVNSRDAMPRGGELRVQTRLVDWGPAEMENHPGARVGRYVEMVVSDTGVGMTEDIRTHLFEPFFTTKDVGKGTGLGLSMVQGIVVQSDGHIDVDTQPETGTTFKIYLPASEFALSDAEQTAAPSAQTTGHGSVLVVEDQAEVRTFVATALRRFGYTVFEAAGSEDALLLCDRERGGIDLVLTDMVMPKGGGKELADRILKQWPRIRVLFMSGYTDDARLRPGPEERELNFIQKPFTAEQLATMVRQLLAKEDREEHA